MARSKSKKSRRSKSKHSKKSKRKKKSNHTELPVAEEDDAEEALEDTPGSEDEDPNDKIVAAIQDGAANVVLQIENAKPKDSKEAPKPKGRPPVKSPARTKSPGTAAARPKGPAKSPKPVPKSTPAKSPSAKTASGRVTKAPDSYTDKK